MIFPRLFRYFQIPRFFKAEICWWFSRFLRFPEIVGTLKYCLEAIRSQKPSCHTKRVCLTASVLATSGFIKLFHKIPWFFHDYSGIFKFHDFPGFEDFQSLWEPWNTVLKPLVARKLAVRHTNFVCLTASVLATNGFIKLFHKRGTFICAHA